ncbi:FG-GAP repeat domain-containing protein, partial [Acidobacteriota bacterium]
DADPDIYLSNDLSKNQLYRNLDGIAFEDIGLVAGVDDSRGGMGTAVGDYDNDGDLDLFVSNWQDETNVLYRNLLSDLPATSYYPGVFEDVTVFAGISEFQDMWVGEADFLIMITTAISIFLLQTVSRARPEQVMRPV